jgi:Cyclin, N-terminal domain
MGMNMGVIEKAYIYTDVLLSHTKIQPQVLSLVGVSAIMLASKVRHILDILTSNTD